MHAAKTSPLALTKKSPPGDLQFALTLRAREQQMIDMVTESKINERDIDKNGHFYKVK